MLIYIQVYIHKGDSPDERNEHNRHHSIDE
jgi:hypothetical protein